MADIVKYEQVRDKLIVLRGEPVLLDADVAALYGVETRIVNQAVKNNPDKFPDGFLYKLNNHEVADLRSKFLIASLQSGDNQRDSAPTLLRRNQHNPTAFTERGLYMLATILKSPQATQTTLAIIDTFVQIRELARTMQSVAQTEDENEKKSLMKRSGELIGDVIGSQLDTVGSETEIELNFAVVKIKHKVVRRNK